MATPYRSWKVRSAERLRPHLAAHTSGPLLALPEGRTGVDQPNRSMRFSQICDILNRICQPLSLGPHRRQRYKIGGRRRARQCGGAEAAPVLTWREAQTQTYADAFLVIAVCFVVTTLMVPLLRKIVPPKTPATESH